MLVPVSPGEPQPGFLAHMSGGGTFVVTLLCNLRVYYGAGNTANAQTVAEWMSEIELGKERNELKEIWSFLLSVHCWQAVWVLSFCSYKRSIEGQHLPDLCLVSVAGFCVTHSPLKMTTQLNLKIWIGRWRQTTFQEKLTWFHVFRMINSVFKKSVLKQLSYVTSWYQLPLFPLNPRDYPGFWKIPSAQAEFLNFCLLHLQTWFLQLISFYLLPF